MEQIFKITYEVEVVENDIPSLDKKLFIRIERVIKEKLTLYPDIFGKPLRHSLRGYFSLRAGSCRVVFRVDKNTVKIFAIGYRKNVYLEAVKRVLKT